MIDVPRELSKEQQSAVEQLSRTLGGDPRAGLFQNGATATGSAAKDADVEADAAKAGEG